MPTLTRREPGARPLRKATMDRLEKLANVLNRRGLAASMMAPIGRMPRLQVSRAGAPDLAGEVYAWRCQDGRWWFWWAWAERIGDARDLDAAADVIERAIAAVHGMD